MVPIKVSPSGYPKLPNSINISSIPSSDIRFPSNPIVFMFVLPFKPILIIANTPLLVKKHSLISNVSNFGQMFSIALPINTAPLFSKSSAPQKSNTRNVEDRQVAA